MEAAQCGNNAGATGSKTSEFERALDGLGSAVTEEDMIESPRRQVGKAFEQPSAHVIVDDFGAGDEAMGLGCEGGGNFRSSMSNISDAMPCRAVDIFPALFIPYYCSAATHDGDGTLAVDACCVGIFEFDGRNHTVSLSLEMDDASIIVPEPCSTSSSEALPIQMRGTPPCNASCAPSSFLRMRPLA